MNWIPRIGIAVAIVFGLAVATVAEDDPSVMAGILTRDGIGAAAIAMGNAYTAIASDTTAGYYNPAGLAGVPGTRVGGMYESKFDPALGTSFQYVSATHRIDGLGLGLGVTLVRRVDRDIPTGSGVFDASETVVLLSSGYDLSSIIPFGSAVAGGVSLKLYASQGYADAQAVGIGLDGGVMATFSFSEWTACVGISSTDLLGSTLKWRGTKNEIAEVVPWGQRVGLAITVPAWNLCAAVDGALYATQPDLNVLRLGIEYTLFGLSFRAGLDAGTPVIGVGVGVLEWTTIDAAIVFQDLGTSFVVSSEFVF